MKSIWLLLALLATGAAHAVALFDTDTFTAGTDEGWGSGAIHTITTGGGPAGSGDRYLRVGADGSSGPGGKMATHNNYPQYIGSYLAVPATGIRGYFRNESAVDIRLRLVFFGSDGSRWTSTTGLDLAAGSGWTRHSFGLDQASLTRVMGSGTYAGCMTDVYQVMIRHDTALPSANGVAQAGAFGMDNIEVVPEPGTMTAIALGAAALLRRKRA